MRIEIQPEKMTIDELKELLLNIHEKYYIEMKKATELPNAFWESYSSFSNTSGGYIILGVAESSPKNEIIGVGNPSKALTSLWDQVSNPNKVNYRNIENQDVNTYEIDGKTVIIIFVKEAAETMKPVYLNGRLENTWIRTGDGDRKATKEEIAAFLRNAQPGQDSLGAEGFSLDDLDLDSIITFKERVSKRYPKMKYIEMSHEEFLTKIGACHIDRVSGKLIVKRGALLFLGKVNSIKELFPHFHLDYFNRKGNNPRWIDRVSDDEPGDYEINIYNFYNIVYEKIKALLQEAFALDSFQLRIPFSDFDETIHEYDVCRETEILTMHDFVEKYREYRNNGCIFQKTKCNNLVVTLDEQIIGVCRVEKYPEYDSDGNVGYYIRPSRRGNGYAKHIIKAAEILCAKRRYGIITAVSASNNLPSIRSLKSAGWIETGILYDWADFRIGVEFAPEMYVGCIADTRKYHPSLPVEGYFIQN